MKIAFTTFTTALIATIVASTCATHTSTADVMIQGAQSTPRPAAMDINIATKDLLNRPTALLNKNTLVTDNNVFIARSNLIFTQNDRIALRKKVEAALSTTTENDTSAVLAKSVMRMVSAPTTDTALMTKASGVVAAKGGDSATLASRIANFVDSTAKAEMDREQSSVSQMPRGVIMMIGTKDVLRQPTAVVNKNIALDDNQIAISNSHVMPSQNDQVTMTSGAKVADAILPGSAVNVGQVKTSESDMDSESPVEYRMQFMYPKEDVTQDKDDDKQTEHWGLGWGLGWRYPLGYWNRFGLGLYGGGCGLGYGFGGYYYC
jgi:hypothetical protein